MHHVKREKLNVLTGKRNTPEEHYGGRPIYVVTYLLKRRELKVLLIIFFQDYVLRVQRCHGFWDSLITPAFGISHSGPQVEWTEMIKTWQRRELGNQKS